MAGKGEREVLQRKKNYCKDVRLVTSLSKMWILCPHWKVEPCGENKTSSQKQRFCGPSREIEITSDTCWNPHLWIQSSLGWILSHQTNGLIQRIVSREGTEDIWGGNRQMTLSLLEVMPKTGEASSALHWRPMGNISCFSVV